MLTIDQATEFGKRAVERLRDESIIWLTTVAKDGSPFPKPVWFFWDGETVWIYSQPGALAVKHMARSPRVSLNFDGGQGPGGVIALTGTAECAAVEGHNAAFLAKYAEKLPALTAQYGEDFPVLYTVLIRVVPDRIMGH